jgi:hypothetical protein
MTEAEWLACTERSKMLYFLDGSISLRKRRLFAVSCCNAIEPYLRDQRSRNAIEVVDRLADGHASYDELESAHRMACEALADLGANKKIGRRRTLPE